MKTCDLSYLKSHSPNNPKFLLQMVEMILKETPPYLQKMKECLLKQDWSGLHLNTHKIKPSIDFIGMSKDIFATAKSLEENAKEQKNIEEIPSQFEIVNQAFQEAFIELSEEIKNLK